MNHARTRSRRGGALLAAALTTTLTTSLAMTGGSAHATDETDRTDRGSRVVAPAPATEDRTDVRVAAPQHGAQRKAPEVAPTKSGADPQIVGGTTAPTGAYPFFTSVQTSGGNHFCGGTLVASEWVLTAAHCVDGGTTPGQLRVVIGANRLSQPSAGETRTIDQIRINPSWNAATFQNDVALLHLSTPSTQRWARLAGPTDTTAAGTTARVIGHGRTTEGGTGSDQLLQVDVPILADAVMSLPIVYGGSFFGATMIGAGELAGGKDSCQGDSGGPLFLPGTVQSALVGDVSWGTGCARSLKPGVYGEVFQGGMRSFVNSVVTRPGNDDFAGTGISGTSGRVYGSNTDATHQPGEAAGVGTPDTTVWYSWTAPQSGPTTFDLRDASFDTTLGVFTGGLGSLSLVAGNDDYAGSRQSKVTFTAVAGTTYRIVVDGFAAQHGPFSLAWAQNPPVNDNLAAATLLTGATGKKTGTNVNATGEPGEPNHGSVPDTSVWYRWTAPESGQVVFNTREAAFDTVLAVYTGSTFTNLVQRASNDQYGGTSQSRVVLNVTAGTTYRIAVDGFGAQTGPFHLQWAVNRPANDDLASATVVSGLWGYVKGSSVRATGEPGELDYHGGAAADNSVWFSWTPPESAETVVRLRKVSSGFSPGVAVYTGSGYPVTKVTEGATSLTFNAVAGMNYRIAVDGNGGSTGAFKLEYVMARCNGKPATIAGLSGVITGTAGPDIIVGSAVRDRISGLGGNDIVCGLGGNDVINGGPGNDNLMGGKGADKVNGNGGRDRIGLVDGVRGNDRGDGGPGRDTANRDRGDILVRVP